MNTIENNRLIAEFMGWKYNTNKSVMSYPLDDNSIFIGRHLTMNLKFHSSWDWLMAVVEKIESDERYDVEILQYGTIIMDNQKEIVNNVADISFDKKIEHTYDAVVEFIKQF